MANPILDGGEGADVEIPNNGGNEGGDEIDIDLDGEDGGEGGEGAGAGEGGDKGKGKFANETPEQRSARLRRMSDQYDKKHKLGKYAEAGAEDGKQPISTQQTGKLDYGQKAYLNSEGIKGSDEHALVVRIMKESGNDMESVIASGYFKTELKTLRETTAAAAASPQGKNRSGNTSMNQVDYWLGKGGLPPDTPENRKLRQDVVNARLKKETDTSMFSANPVVGGA